MTGNDILLWAGIAGAAYAFSGTFRREVNGWIVKLADKVRNDTPEAAKAKETHILEDVAFQMFEEDHPGDPRLAGGWHNLPQEIRKTYITRAVESLIPADGKPAPAETTK